MTLALLAALLLAAAQDTTTPNPPEEPAAPSDDGPAERDDRVSGAASDVVAGRSEEVCRRVTFYDDFGRQRTRRVCRPR